MQRTIVQRLRRIIELSDELLSVADASPGRDSGGVFLAARDSAHRLRRMVQEELERQGASVVPDGHDVDEEASATDAWVGKRVLVVDDEPDTVTYLATWFSDRGFETVTASDGVEAWERLTSETPDLVTLDLSMPNRSGVKVYRQIKDHADLRRVPVIIISALGTPMKTFLDRRKQVPSPEGFLGKPIDLLELARVVRRLMASSGAAA